MSNPQNNIVDASAIELVDAVVNELFDASANGLVNALTNGLVDIPANGVVGVGGGGDGVVEDMFRFLGVGGGFGFKVAPVEKDADLVSDSFAWYKVNEFEAALK